LQAAMGMQSQELHFLIVFTFMSIGVFTGDYGFIPPRNKCSTALKGLK